MNIPYDEMPEKIEELMAEVESLESENKHLLDLQKSMDKQYAKLEQENKQLKEILHNINISDGETTTPVLDLIEENQQLKGKLKTAEHNKEQSQIQCRMYRNKRKTLNHRIKRREQQRDRYKSMLDELKEWLLCMQEVSHLDLKCLQVVLSKMQEIESGKNE